MAITDAMIEAGCKARHTTRSWNKAARDPGMTAWVSSHREAMRRILTAAIEAGARDAFDVWQDYLTEHKDGIRSEQAALAFGYAAGRP